MPYIIKRTISEEHSIYVTWDASGSGSYWIWTDRPQLAERFELGSGRIEAALLALAKDGRPYTLQQVKG